MAGMEKLLMSIAAIAAILAVIVIVIGVPLGIMVFLHKRGAPWTTILIGAGTFILFVALEQVLHYTVITSGAMAALQETIWLYGLYGGLAAGLFEETGRLVAFRYILKNRRDRLTSLAYGIGHGGIESILLVGLTMIANLSLGLAYTSGAELSAEMMAMAESLVSTPAGMFLWSGFERLYAIAMHMALSVLVFAAVRTSRRRLYLAAILVHAGVDCAAVIANACHLPIAATELLLAVLTAAAALWAVRIYKKLPETAEIS